MDNAIYKLSLFLSVFWFSAKLKEKALGTVKTYNCWTVMCLLEVVDMVKCKTSNRTFQQTELTKLARRRKDEGQK